MPEMYIPYICLEKWATVRQQHSDKLIKVN